MIKVKLLVDSLDLFNIMDSIEDWGLKSEIEFHISGYDFSTTEMLTENQDLITMLKLTYSDKIKDIINYD